jgi:hypothetical protein
MSFNRPHYLKQVVESLNAQRQGQIGEREIHLFQDGAVNLFSGFRYAADVDIRASIDVFVDRFPGGTVHDAKDNLGICENFHRAERYVFAEREFDCAYFFEDDLVLSPVYIQMLDRLASWVMGTDNVAYFSAYGNYYASPEEIRERRRDLITLDHLWGFGLLRRHWIKMQPVLAPYYGLVRGTDYSRRFDRDIFELYGALDACPRASSQDAAKAFACDRLGLWRCNTMAPFAKYIGATGQHMTQETYDALGFSHTTMATSPLDDLKFPNFPQIAEHLREQRALFKEIRRSEWARIVEGLPKTKLYDPGRKCTREDVVFGYRLFLNREPEIGAGPESVAEKETVFDFVAGLVASREHDELAPARPTRMCDTDDIIYAYRLCLHRDPESDSIFNEHVGRTDAFALTQAIWKDDERRKLGETIVPRWAIPDA